MALATMTKEEVLEACVENNGYETPELNDILYLHYKGFPQVENLEPYVNCKAVYLESNGLSSLEGLGHMTMLRCLFAGKNLIDSCLDLSPLTSLVTLDLSHNSLDSLEGLETLLNLESVNAANNALADEDAILPLEGCGKLHTLDISNNVLEGPGIMPALAKLAHVPSMCLNGNPVVRATPQFRKNMICNLPRLRYLDRPVFKEERAGAEAWREGGPEAERRVREELIEAKKTEQRESLQRFRDWQKEVRDTKAATDVKTDAEKIGAPIEA